MARIYICGRREEMAATSALSTSVPERVGSLKPYAAVRLMVWATGQSALMLWALLGLTVVCGAMVFIFIMQKKGGWLLKPTDLIP